MIYIIQGDTFLFLKTGKFQTAAFGAAVSFWIKNGILVGNLKCSVCRSAVFWHPWFSSKQGWILFIQLQVIQPFAEILDGFFDGILCCLHGKSGKIIRVTGSPQDLKKGLVGQYPSGSKSFVDCFCLLQLIKNKFLQICQFSFPHPVNTCRIRKRAALYRFFARAELSSAKEKTSLNDFSDTTIGTVFS